MSKDFGTNVRFGQLIGIFRDRQAVSQDDLAKSSKLSKNTVYNLENEVGKPKSTTVKKVIGGLLELGCFSKGRERNEILELWQSIDLDILIDPIWLNNLLDSKQADLSNSISKKSVDALEEQPLYISNKKINRLRVFLCHASDDKERVRSIYQKLKIEGFEPWLDEEELRSGQRWEEEIKKAVKASQVVLVCLSNHSITKEGFVQREINFALDIASEKPEDTFFIIPIKLEECKVPRKLLDWQCINYFDESRYEKLKKDLHVYAVELGLDIVPPQQIIEQQINKLRAEFEEAEKTDDYDIVIQKGEAMLKIDPDNESISIKTSNAYNEFATQLISDDKEDRAINMITRAIELNKNNPDYYRTRATLFISKKQYADVVTDLTHAIQLDPISVYAYWLRAEAYICLDDFEAAIVDCNNGLEIEPDNMDCRHFRLEAYKKLGYDQLVQEEQYMLDKTWIEKLNIELDDTTYNKFDTIFLTRVIKACNKILEKQDNQDIRNRKAAALIKRAEIWLDNKLYEKTINDCTEAIEINPTNISLYYEKRAYYQRILNKLQNAIDDYTKAIDLDPNDAEKYYWRGKTYKEMGNDIASENDFNKAKEKGSIAILFDQVLLKTTSSEKEIEAAKYANLADQFFEDNSYNEAIEYSKKAIELCPHRWDYYYSLARFYLKTENYDVAIINASKVIDYNKKYASGYWLRGVSYFYKDEYYKAQQDLEKALSYYPDNGHFNYWLANILRELGNVEEAMKYYQQAVKLGDKFAEKYIEGPNKA